ncbi:putative isochorismatase hydrolase [Siminovitchia terrae]|uniref:Cysteine hydrolase n=1 Tax=Siminovitchia terrae TaxID=1914933 RepID=A0A429X1B4_SIMTE|nr:isochorismatase family cysteine hydrolase [Siminovitchia terrae]RST57274.1 cysteine hydrolase [Siminovitchia terrae]GIN95450.1 putative isochorismatase hydrolase [Siminovitchia terrae]
MGLQINHIDPKKTALLVIDMQNDFVASGAPLETAMGQKMLPRLKDVLEFSRTKGISVIYTAHVHREDGSDMGLYEEIYPSVADRACLIDGTLGTEIYPEVAPLENEIVIKKHRYSPFFGTNLDMILRNQGIENVAIVGLTTEDCCFAAARDAMYRGYKVAFLSDVTGTYDYGDIGFGKVPAEEVHRVCLTILGGSTAHVMKAEDFMQKVEGTEEVEQV